MNVRFSSSLSKPLFILLLSPFLMALFFRCSQPAPGTEMTSKEMSQSEIAQQKEAITEKVAFDASPPGCLNGSTLPCYTGPVNARNIGPCTDGVETCENGKWSECRGQIVPKPEVCNGVDDDCDGDIDEKSDIPDKPCRLNDGKGPCDQGMFTCVEGKVVCARTSSPSEEICDGKDNDCDGRVDELFSCKKGPAKENERCDPAGESEGVQVPCDSGLVCLRYGDNLGTYCHVPCQPNAQGQCTHKPNLTCVATQDGSTGVCLKANCQTDQDCWPGYECRDRTNQQGKLCFPKRPQGPYGLASLCKVPIEKSGCKENHRCVLASAGAKQGVCANSCATDADCSSVTKDGKTYPSRCIVLGNSMSYCLLPCSQEEQGCPSELRCQGSGNRQFCLSP